MPSSSSSSSSKSSLDKIPVKEKASRKQSKINIDESEIKLNGTIDQSLRNDLLNL
jgi:hypothetical protein